MNIRTIWWMSLIGLALVGSTPAARAASWPTRVSPDRHHLLDGSGRPFFYLGDTAWELFHRLSFDEAEEYLKDRAAKRFTVIQAVVLAEYGGLDQPNANGDRPLVERDPTRPIATYFAHVDRVVARAGELGLVVGMLPTWGDKWNKKWGQGPEIFTPENAATYGEFLGRRYRDQPIVWILGGDRPVETDRHRAIVQAMAEGLRRGDEGRHLIAFHPNGGRGSADFFADAPWLDFHMAQTGHGFDHANYDRIAADYARTPTKPCLDAEPGYEDHPAEFKPANGYLDDAEVRKSLYWSLFAGACGYTYGCHDIWQFLDPGRNPPVSSARTPWRSALKLPGAGQVRHARTLIESRPILDRIPDQTLLTGDPGRQGDHIQATRARDGSYAFIYTAAGRPFTVDLARLTGDKLRATWFDPRDGSARPAEVIPRNGRREFTPPSNGRGQDWVLILDDASAG